MKRTPLKRGGRLAKRGARARREEKALTAFREAVRARCDVGNGFYRCERCAVTVPLESFEAHHKRGRGQGGSHNPETNGAGLCGGPGTPDCHGRLHAGLLPDTSMWIVTRKPQGDSR